MSSDPFLDPSQSPLSPPPDPAASPTLPARNPERVLALLSSPESPITSALTDFAGAGRGGGIFAGLGGVLPLVLREGTRQLADVPGAQIDQTLLELAKMLLGARSTDADPPVTLVVGPLTELPVAVAPEGPAHNED